MKFIKEARGLNIHKKMDKSDINNEYQEIQTLYKAYINENK